MSLIYIVGSGHSGSTLLNVLLGHHENIIDLGEAGALNNHLIGQKRICSCGKDASSCEFWSLVIRRWIQIIGPKGAARYPSLCAQCERWNWRNVSPKGTQNSFNSQLYSDFTNALYEAVRVVSGKTNIVDSSKSSIRALALSRIPGIDLRIIHLVRDARGVVWSYVKRELRKRNLRPATLLLYCCYTSCLWLLSNMAAKIVCRVAGVPSMFVRYEDLVTQSHREMQRISRFVGEKLDAISEAFSAGESIPINHLIAGNHLRRRKTVTLKPDFEWRKRFPKSYQRLVWIIVCPFGWHYGYRRTDGTIDQHAPT